MNKHKSDLQLLCLYKTVGLLRSMKYNVIRILSVFAAPVI